MTHRSHPAPQCPGAGPINVANLMTSAVTCTVDGRKRQAKPRHQIIEANRLAPCMTNAAVNPVLE